ncbi:tonB-system energizer ExbB [uncultured Paracoccus sp.]|uniref:tonB-system energizer ExbB n=1 Tax=uncultured Paracoccus sp. TaxID=189685 RepID=UPI00262D9948|nr:tonB-system energizer ExbB [uncultured Paracoccus sp.]
MTRLATIVAGTLILGASAAAAQPVPLPASVLPHDLSPVGMFRQADIVVQAVMLLLVAASVVTWTILLVKSLELARANRRAARSLAGLMRARSLDEAVAAAAGRHDPASHMLRLARYERARATGPRLMDRIVSQLSGVVVRAGRRTAMGTGVLATIGSTAPFVGLFGTVWGIMNSFIGISQAQTTNLAVVAPGIAEALLATALGLVAAIPAVVIYNVFARAIAGYRLRLNDAAQAVQRLVSRDLDRHAEQAL